MDATPAEVLVVDDVAASRRATAAILTRMGHAVSEAAGGVEALTMVRARSFEVILLDVEMPDLTGLAVCRTLKADPRTRAIPVVFMTAAGADEDVIRGLEAGAVDYVTKGVHPTILQRRVANAIAAYRAEALQRRLADERAHALEVLAAAQARIVEERKQLGLVTLATGLAHEINNPLAAAIASLAYYRSEGADADNRRDALDELGHALERIAKIVARTTRLSERVSRMEPVPVDQVLRAIVEPLGALLAQKGIALAHTLEPTPPVAGAGHLGEVATELIHNAATALGGRGNIRVTCGAVDERVRFTVSDDGPGMDATVRARAFEPFFTRKKEWLSVGLGLSTCHAIVTSLGGSIAIDSELGRGARIQVEIPIGA